MRVLFFCTDSISSTVRVIPLLELLRDAGEVQGYSAVDRDMATRDSNARFDVLIVHRNPSERQFAWLQGSRIPFLYDIDDLLLSKRIDLKGRRKREQNAIQWCLKNAQFVTSPSRHLLETLEYRMGERLGQRAVFLPNTGLQKLEIKRLASSPDIIWISSHGQQYQEYCDVGAGVSAAARKLATRIIMVGHFSEEVKRAVPNAHYLSWIEPARLGRFLAEGCFVAAAPMPTALELDQQEFVDCKSDIKIAQYGSVGIAGLYSSALPYRDSDLPCALAQTNTASDWELGVLQLAANYPAGGMHLAEHKAILARQPELVARQLLSILNRVRNVTQRPFSYCAIPTPAVFRRVERRLRSLRTRLWYEIRLWK
jgi:hypothetical protein